MAGGRVHLTASRIGLLCLTSSFIWSRTRNTPFHLTFLTTCCAGALLWLFYWCYLWPYCLSPLRHVPTVPSFPLWGSVFVRAREEIGLPERRWHIQYGKTVRFFLPFAREQLSIASDEAIKEVTVRHPYNFVKAKKPVQWAEPVLGSRGIVLADGAVHQRQRKALAPAFAKSAIRTQESKFWSKAQKTVEIMASDAMEEDPAYRVDNQPHASLEVLEYMCRGTLDALGSAAFGWEFDSLRDPNVPVRVGFEAYFSFDILMLVIQGLRFNWKWASRIPCRPNRQIQNTSTVMKDIGNQVIEAKLNAHDPDAKSKDVVDLVVNQNEKLLAGHGDRLSIDEMSDQIVTFLGAGHDTTANCIAWTLLRLAKHQEIQRRLREEIRSELPDLGEKTPEELAQCNVDRLPYLNKVIQESLRVIPPVPMVTRKNAIDVELDGYLVPAWTSIHIFSNAVNRLPCYWGPDADTFDPDRWDDLPETWIPNAHQTFLEGPRGCIGRSFAEAEIRIFLCCLVSQLHFDVDGTRPDPEDSKMWRIVLRPKNGIHLVVSRAGEDMPKPPTAMLTTSGIST